MVTLMVRILPKQYSACLRMTASSRKACPSPDDYLEHCWQAAHRNDKNKGVTKRKRSAKVRRAYAFISLG